MLCDGLDIIQVSRSGNFLKVDVHSCPTSPSSSTLYKFSAFCHCDQPCCASWSEASQRYCFRHISRLTWQVKGLEHLAQPVPQSRRRMGPQFLVALQPSKTKDCNLDKVRAFAFPCLVSCSSESRLRLSDFQQHVRYRKVDIGWQDKISPISVYYLANSQQSSKCKREDTSFSGPPPNEANTQD